MRFVVPFTLALTLLRFGDHVLLLWLLAWLTVFPETLPLPQTEHTFAIYNTSFELSSQHSKTILSELRDIFKRKMQEYEGII
jgi:hypothetical protein